MKWRFEYRKRIKRNVINPVFDKKKREVKIINYLNFEIGKLITMILSKCHSDKNIFIMCSTNTVNLIQDNIRAYECYSDYKSIEENIKDILIISGGVDKQWTASKKIAFIIDNSMKLGEIKILEEI